MPVTAKLSRRFYEQFGDELANELVDWFNAVDATYRSDLRELNELNFSRFKAELEQRFAQQDAKWEQRLAQQDAKWEERFAGLRGEFADLRVGVTGMKVDLVRWMFALWTGQLLALAGFVFVMLRLR